MPSHASSFQPPNTCKFSLSPAETAGQRTGHTSWPHYILPRRGARGQGPPEGRTRTSCCRCPARIPTISQLGNLTHRRDEIRRVRRASRVRSSPGSVQVGPTSAALRHSVHSADLARPGPSSGHGGCRNSVEFTIIERRLPPSAAGGCSSDKARRRESRQRLGGGP
jgi:hypothetical protein